LFVAPQQNQDIRGVDLLLKHIQAWHPFGETRKTAQGKLRKSSVAVKNVAK